MYFRISRNLLLSLVLATLCSAAITGCAYYCVAKVEPSSVARDLGFANCKVTEPMRRYQTLDYADQLGDPNLEESPDWRKAIAMMQPGDDLRYVYCKDGNNFFGLFRGTSLLLKFGGMIFD